ncbi:unnamed protein product [Linum trigynum]|uniref:Cytochrome P450 n=1 Tax=Linum trigynum TaxID=586398 RepID=A0AAV2FFE6_9ROSI
MRRVNGDLNKLAEEWIEEHRSKRTTSGDDGEQEEDFIDVLLRVLKDPDPAGYDLDTVFKSTIMTLIVGGTDTTTVTLIWALSLFLNHPSSLKEVVDKLDMIVDAPVDMTGAPGLTVSKAIPLEVLVRPRLPAYLYELTKKA